MYSGHLLSPQKTWHLVWLVPATSFLLCSVYSQLSFLTIFEVKWPNYIPSFSTLSNIICRNRKQIFSLQKKWPEGYQLAGAVGYKFPYFVKTNLSDVVPQASEVLINLLDALLEWNPLNRPTAQGALKHQYFQVSFKIDDWSISTDFVEVLE